MGESLSKNMKIFVDEYLIDRNGTRAYLVAYPNVNNENVAAASASKLLRKSKVAAEVQKRLEELSQKAQISQERVLEEYARIAFLDPRRFFKEDGTLKSVHDLDDDVAAALAGMDITQRFCKDEDTTEFTSKVKIADKLKALENLSKYLGLFEKDNGQRGDQKIIVTVTDDD